MESTVSNKRSSKVTAEREPHDSVEPVYRLTTEAMDPTVSTKPSSTMTCQPSTGRLPPGGQAAAVSVCHPMSGQDPRTPEPGPRLKESSSANSRPGDRVGLNTGFPPSSVSKSPSHRRISPSIKLCLPRPSFYSSRDTTTQRPCCSPPSPPPH